MDEKKPYHDRFFITLTVLMILFGAIPFALFLILSLLVVIF